MFSSLQTLIAFGLVALAVAYLAWSFLRKRQQPRCSGEDCGAVSPDARALLKKLKKK